MCFVTAKKKSKLQARADTPTDAAQLHGQVVRQTRAHIHHSLLTARLSCWEESSAAGRQASPRHCKRLSRGRSVCWAPWTFPKCSDSCRWSGPGSSCSWIHSSIVPKPHKVKWAVSWWRQLSCQKAKVLTMVVIPLNWTRCRSRRTVTCVLNRQGHVDCAGVTCPRPPEKSVVEPCRKMNGKNITKSHSFDSSSVYSCNPWLLLTAWFDVNYHQ